MGEFRETCENLTCGLISFSVADSWRKKKILADIFQVLGCLTTKHAISLSSDFNFPCNCLGVEVSTEEAILGGLCSV